MTPTRLKLLTRIAVAYAWLFAHRLHPVFVALWQPIAWAIFIIVLPFYVIGWVFTWCFLKIEDGK